MEELEPREEWPLENIDVAGEDKLDGVEDRVLGACTSEEHGAAGSILAPRI